MINFLAPLSPFNLKNFFLYFIGKITGLPLLLLKYGSKKLRDVLEPAISIATNGYPLVPNILNTINSVKELFLDDWKTSANIYLPNNKFSNTNCR